MERPSPGHLTVVTVEGVDDHDRQGDDAVRGRVVDHLADHAEPLRHLRDELVERLVCVSEAQQFRQRHHGEVAVAVGDRDRPLRRAHREGDDAAVAGALRTVVLPVVFGHDIASLGADAGTDPTFIMYLYFLVNVRIYARRYWCIGGTMG